MSLNGYGRASTSKQVSSPEIQRKIIVEYAARLWPGQDVTYWIDPASSGPLNIWERPQGGPMMSSLKEGDTIIVAHLDRMSRSGWNTGQILQHCTQRKIALHVCDLPGGVFDPDSPISRLLMQMLAIFAEYERGLIIGRIVEGKQASKERGLTAGSDPPWGYMAERRWDSLRKRYARFNVPNPHERAISAKCVELRAAGYTIEQIRRYLNEEWKVRTRRGTQFVPNGVIRMIGHGMKWLSEQENERRPRPPLQEVEMVPDDVEETEEAESLREEQECP